MKLEFWAVMDKHKKAIACGSPRNRSMRMIESLKDHPIRILMYGTEKRTLSAFGSGLGFYDETNGYLASTYKDKTRFSDSKYFHGDYGEICIPVKVSLEFDE